MHVADEAMDQAPKKRPDVEKVLGLGKSRTSLFQRWRNRVLIGAALAAALGVWAWSGRNAPDASVRFVTAPTEVGDLTVVVTATGAVRPTNQIDISSELSGTIREVLVDYNSEVTAAVQPR